MPAKPQIVNEANKMLRFLRSEELLTDEHALTVSLLKDLCRRLAETVLPSQAAALSHEIRNTMALLPRPAEKPKPSPATDFMAELEALEETAQG